MASEEGAVIACHTKAEFDDTMAKAKESGKLVIIDFTASWCGPCRTIAPVFIDLAKRFSGAVFLKVDVDELKEVTEDYDVQAMPTFVFVKNGETVHKVVGAKKESLQAGIERHLNLATTASESA